MQRSIVKSLAAAVVAGTLLAGCGAQPTATTGAADPVKFQMHWSWSASTAGFAAADTKGLYENAGLTEGRGSGTTVQLVATGQADMGVADAVAIMQQIDKGAPLVVVGTVNQVTNIAMQALESSGINTVADLRGKTVAVPQGGAYAFLFPLFLELNGLTEQDVTVANVPFESMVASLLEGNVDAIVGGQDSHVALVEQNAKFKDFLFADYGVSAVAHSIFTTEKYLEENPEGVRKFVAATLQGWTSALDDPEQAIAAIKSHSPDSVDERARIELKFLLPLLCAADAKHIGRADPEHWQRSVELLSRAKLIPEGLDPTKFVTYDFLPPESELRTCK